MIQRIARGLWALWSIHTYSFVINIVSMKSKFTLFSFLMHIPSNIAFDHSSVYNILNKVILSKCNVKSSACEIASLMSDSCSFNHLQYCSSILIYNWCLFLKFKSHPTFFFLIEYPLSLQNTICQISDCSDIGINQHWLLAI